MTNQQIAEALSALIPAGNWGSFTGDAKTSDEFSQGFIFTGDGIAPTWEQVQAVVIPVPVEPTLTEKLASIGLIIPDLKAALGL